MADFREREYERGEHRRGRERGRFRSREEERAHYADDPRSRRTFENLEDWEQPTELEGETRFSRRDEGSSDYGFERARHAGSRLPSVRRQGYLSEFGEQQPYSGERGGFAQSFEPYGRPEYGLQEYGRQGYGRHEPFGRQGQFAGRGPKGYKRSDERLREEVCDRLTEAAEIDATEISVKVREGEVTLEGTVPNRRMKRAAEDCAEDISGVQQVHNQIRVQVDAGRAERQDGNPSGSQEATSGSRGTSRSGSTDDDRRR